MDRLAIGAPEAIVEGRVHVSGPPNAPGRFAPLVSVPGRLAPPVARLTRRIVRTDPTR